MLKAIALTLFAALLGAEAAPAQAMTLTSPDIAPGAAIALKQVYKGCGGGNISPALSWSGAPKDAKSFAVTVYDPDARAGRGWWHWVVFNIPPDVMSLPKGAGDPKGPEAPKGAVQSRTDFGVPGYNGPLPPQGRSAAPLSFHRLRRRHAEARGGRKHHRRRGRPHAPLPHARQSRARGRLGTLSLGASPGEPCAARAG